MAVVPIVSIVVPVMTMAIVCGGWRDGAPEQDHHREGRDYRSSDGMTREGKHVCCLISPGTRSDQCAIPSHLMATTHERSAEELSSDNI
jgi:hypothetical protein